MGSAKAKGLSIHHEDLISRVTLLLTIGLFHHGFVRREILRLRSALSPFFFCVLCARLELAPFASVIRAATPAEVDASCRAFRATGACYHAGRCTHGPHVVEVVDVERVAGQLVDVKSWVLVESKGVKLNEGLSREMLRAELLKRSAYRFGRTYPVPSRLLSPNMQQQRQV